MSLALLSAPPSNVALETGKLTHSILNRIAQGEQSAVQDCLDRYGGLVWSLCNQLSANQNDAEDAAQEIFVELWQKAKSFDSSLASETTFIAMIARRRLIDRRRKLQRSPDFESMSAEAIDVSDAPEIDHAELADEAAKAAKCMEKLSSEQRKVISYSVHYGLSHQRISTKLKMPLGTVKSYARRALLQLRSCMRNPIATSSSGSVT